VRVSRVTRFGRYGVVGCLAATGLLIASLAPPASASHPSVFAQTGPAHLLHLKVGPAGQTQSTNWSGYAATSAGGTYSQVSSTWQEPAVQCAGGPEQIAVFWVGIDGYTSGTVEQDGSLADCSGGVASYYTWWEMYPANSVQIVGTTVQPGDHITSSVVRSGNTYTLKVTDQEHPANSFTTTQTCACANSSAEWIAERPSGGGGLFPLPNFGKIVFKHDAATSSTGSGSISQFPNDAITMVNNSHQTLAKPGALKKQGSKFAVKWFQMQ
jgi:Peptidase A4 family